MTEVQQVFGGEVSGGVAGRDAIHNHGPATIHAQIFPPRPESQLMAEFHQHTGIWCPAGAREVFEDLLKHHGFTSPELAAAWRDNALVWDGKANRISTYTPWFVAASGYGMIASALLYLVAYGLPLLLMQGGLAELVALLAALFMFGGAAGLAYRYVLWPHRVAVRVGRALDAWSAPR